MYGRPKEKGTAAHPNPPILGGVPRGTPCITHREFPERLCISLTIIARHLGCLSSPPLVKLYELLYLLSAKQWLLGGLY